MNKEPNNEEEQEILDDLIPDEMNQEEVRETEMANHQEGMYFTPQQLQEFMAKAMAAAVSEARKMTPLEERRYKEEVARERRRDRMAVELSKTEEESQRRKQLGCSHKVDSKTGLSIDRSRADGIWATGGQLHGNELATLCCMRCSWVWRWRTTTAEREYINNSGMLGMAPPSKDRVDEYLAEIAEQDRLTNIRDDEPPKKPEPATVGA